MTHSKPNLRVLEVGAGTGASTRTVLKDLAPSDERILYSKYTFTDISAGLLFAAKENLKTFPNMEYATLDISQDPAEQGFEDRQFDLILATNVIHATKSLRDSLENIQKVSFFVLSPLSHLIGLRKTSEDSTNSEILASSSSG